ncbi:hypothetical protein MKK84_16125, partial [Methylobacterium sp. E-065]|uniref:hypothetical protein n=1 Tax=Methylobacterium sp. E-065 TaxID=2836583 RepID=UPI001FB86264
EGKDRQRQGHHQRALVGRLIAMVPVMVIGDEVALVRRLDVVAVIVVAPSCASGSSTSAAGSRPNASPTFSASFSCAWRR